MHPDFDALLVRYGERLLDLALNLLSAATILIVGLWVAAWAGRAVRRLSDRHPRIDNTLAAFFAWFVRYGITIVVLIAVLRRFGIETTSVVALFGAAALAVGLALQGTLSNVAAGVMLILFRPYRLGDYVELSGRGGVVQDINLFVTELVAPDQVKIVLPNSQCWGAPILNFTAFALRRIDLDFSIPLAVSAEMAMGVAREVLKGEKRLNPEPAPRVLVKSIEHDRTVLTAQGWCASQEQIAIRATLIAGIKVGIEAELGRLREEEEAEAEAKAKARLPNDEA